MLKLKNYFKPSRSREIIRSCLPAQSCGIKNRCTLLDEHRFLAVDTIKLKRTDILEVKDRHLLVNGKPFKVAYPDEPLLGTEGENLVTIVFRGCGCSLNEWEPEEIEGDLV